MPHDDYDYSLRCKVTGNPCGTDTWAINCPCRCENCQFWLRNYSPRDDERFKLFVAEDFISKIEDLDGNKN